MASSSMDETDFMLVSEDMPISSVLLSMGVKVKNQKCGLRLKAALSNFDECYLDAVDFFTQLLPIAKQHFGKHDVLLLPKTPSKKRTRKHFISDEREELNDIMEQDCVSPENMHSIQPEPSTEPVIVEETPANKRVTRNSSKATKKSPRQTRSRKKASSQSGKPQVVVNIEGTELEKSVQIENEPEEVVVNENEPEEVVVNENISKEAVGNENEMLVEENNLKRSSSSSPMLRRSKRSKSGHCSLPVIVLEDVVTPSAVSEENLTAVLLENHVGPEKACEKRRSKRSKSGRDSLPVAVVQSVEQVQTSDCGEENITTVLLENHVEPEKECRESVGRNTELVVVVENMGEDAVEEEIVGREKNDLEIIGMEPEIDVETIMHVEEEQNLCDNQTSTEKRGESSEHQQEDFNEEKNESDETQTDFVANPPTSNVPVADKAVDYNSTDAELSNEVSIECDVSEDILIVEKTYVPVDNAKENCQNKEVPKEVIVVPEETSAEETTQENDSSLSDETNKKPWVRRSTRSSRRISRVSMATQNKRRLSRRISAQANRRSKLLAAQPVVVISTSEYSSAESGMDCHLSELDKLTAEISEHSSIESTDDEPHKKASGPSSSTPESQNPLQSVRYSIKISLNTGPDNNLKGSSSDDAVESSVGKVAGMVIKMNRYSKAIESEQTSIAKTPNGTRRVKRIGSTIKRSSTRPSNIVGGNIQSFIKRPSTKKLDTSEIARRKKLELQRKEEKDKERIGQAELRRKIWAEEQKRKREEKQKRVAETKAAREKEEQDKIQKQVEDRKHLLQVLEQVKKKKEKEDETKKKMREQRKKEADARRLKENDERLKRLQEKEEEDKLYRDMLKRKQELEEQERKNRLLEDKRLQEQKQRDRQREMDEERQRKLREIKEKTQKRVGDNEGEARHEKKNKEEKEKKQKEQDDREMKRIALLIKEKMAHEKKMYEEKREKELKERRELEEQKILREIYKLNQSMASSSAASSAVNKSIEQVKCLNSYQMTPPPAETRKPSTSENYDISDIRSDESTDDEDCPRKKIPSWAQGDALNDALCNQSGPWQLFKAEAGPHVNQPDLDKIFLKKRKRFYQRTSSAHWDLPPIKKQCQV